MPEPATQSSGRANPSASIDAQHGGAQRRVEPALRLARISGIDRQPLDQ